MAKSGFSKEGNLIEITNANKAVDTLLAGASQPFGYNDLGVFQSNLRFTIGQNLDFIPHNYRFKTLIDSPNVAKNTDIINVQNVSDSSPDRVFGTLNLRINKGDAVLSSPRSKKDDNLIVAVQRPQIAPDTGTVLLTRGMANNEIGGQPLLSENNSPVGGFYHHPAFLTITTQPTNSSYKKNASDLCDTPNGQYVVTDIIRNDRPIYQGPGGSRGDYRLQWGGTIDNTPRWEINQISTGRQIFVFKGDSPAINSPRTLPGHFIQGRDIGAYRTGAFANGDATPGGGTGSIVGPIPPGNIPNFGSNGSADVPFLTNQYGVQDIKLFAGGGLLRSYGLSGKDEEEITIVKKNKAAYSPVSGRFTFGKDIRYTFTQGDFVTSIKVKGHDTPYDTSPSSMYPLLVTNYDINAIGQTSFTLKKVSTNSPVCISYNQAHALTLRTTSDFTKLSFNTPAIIRFERKLPVNQNDIFGWVPPLMSNTGGPQDSINLDDAFESYTSLGGSSYDDIYKHFEPLSDMHKNLEITEDEEEITFDPSTYADALNSISNEMDNAKVVGLSRLSTDSPYNNRDQSKKFIFDGVLKIQDPGSINSPGILDGTNAIAPGHDIFNNCPFGPAVYISEDENYARAFSTFDGPWTADRTTGNHSIKTPITTSYEDAEFTKDLQVNKLIFEDRLKIDGFATFQINSPDETFVRARVNLPAGNAADASPRSTGFSHKMPVIIAETDASTGEVNEQTYFLLLRRID